MSELSSVNFIMSAGCDGRLLIIGCIFLKQERVAVSGHSHPTLQLSNHASINLQQRGFFTISLLNHGHTYISHTEKKDNVSHRELCLMLERIQQN